MKRIVFLFLFAIVGSYAQEVKFTANIKNRNSDSIVFRGPKKFRKVIRLNDKGIFAGSFSAESGMYQMGDGTEVTLLYLKNGFDLGLNMDAKMFDETIVYSGKGAKENNFLAQKALIDEEFGNNMPSLTSQELFDKAFAGHNKKLESMLADPALDQDFKAFADNLLKDEKQQIAMQYAQSLAIQKLAGTAAPVFDYENFKGGKTKLSDFKGKYVYIDVWATWCGPCRQEIPFLQKIEGQYHGKNIEFISISIDEQKDHDKWKKMVTDKNLGGVQVFADNNWNSAFIQAFGINSIPRFILIDPNGNVVDADAARPSDPSLQTKLNALVK